MTKIRLSQLFEMAADADAPVIDITNSVLDRLTHPPKRLINHQKVLAWLSGLSTAAAAAMLAFAVWFSQHQTQPFEELLYFVGWAVL